MKPNLSGKRFPMALQKSYISTPSHFSNSFVTIDNKRAKKCVREWDNITFKMQPLFMFLLYVFALLIQYCGDAQNRTNIIL